MDDIIYRNDAINALRQCGKHCIDIMDSYHIDIEDAEYRMMRIPAVDAVPVTRCRDCNEYQQNFHWCKLHDDEMQPNDFCSYGERREENG